MTTQADPSPATPPSTPARRNSREASAEPVPDAVVDAVYERLRALARDTSVSLLVAMGGLIVQEFYGGDLAAWRRGGASDASLRKLAARFEAAKDAPDGTSASGLHRAIGIYELDQRFGVSARKQLTATHLRAVLGLPPEVQRRLLDLAEAEALSTRELEDASARARKHEGELRGRPPLPGFVKAATRLRGLLAPDADWFGGLEQANQMPDDDVAEILATVTATQAKLAEVEAALATRLARTGFDPAL